VVAGLLVLWPAVKILPDLLDLLSSGGFQFGLFLLAVWLLFAFFGGSCLYLAFRLTRADRVARGLSYVLMGGLALAILIGNEHTAGLTITMLLAAASVAVLALTPGPRAFFASGKQGEHPDGLVIARTLIAVWAVIMLAVGLVFLPLGGLGAKYVIVGLFFIGLGGGAFFLSSRLAQGDQTARIIVSAGAGIYLILLLILGDRDPGLLLPLAMVVGIGAYLWIPQDVQRFFNERAAAGPTMRPW
jgi:hypothetical protein